MREVTRTVAVALLLAAGCKRKETPSFKIVQVPNDVSTVVDVLPDRKAPDLTYGMRAREAAAHVDATLREMRRLEDTLTINGGVVAVTMFADRDGIRLIREHPVSPSSRQPNARYYFRGEELLYYESTLRLTKGGATETTNTVIGFDGNRGALERSRTVDGRVMKVGQEVVDSVLTRADALRAELVVPH